jgi:hypothetical protein
MFNFLKKNKKTENSCYSCMHRKFDIATGRDICENNSIAYELSEISCFQQRYIGKCGLNGSFFEKKRF